MNNLITKDKLLNLLKNKKIPFILHKHLALNTVSESEKLRGNIKGMHTKNLFLKNKKNQYFLFSCGEKQKINLKKLSKSLSLENISFANENKLYELLGVKPGSVTPFGLINDTNKVVKFFLDNKILKSTIINFHPLENTSTLSLSVKNFVDFCFINNIIFNVIDFDSYSIIN
mgnify:CR=1 FL=1